MRGEPQRIVFYAEAHQGWFRVLRNPGAHVELDFLSDGIAAQAIARRMNLEESDCDRRRKAASA